MQLTSLTYTSLGRNGLQTSELEDIHQSGRDRNSVAGITSLLVFNGTHFLQIVEGSHDAVDRLLEALKRDERHTGLAVRDQRNIDRRSFPDWPMELMQVNGSYFDARDAIAGRLPESVPEVIQLRLFRMTELISTIEFD